MPSTVAENIAYANEVPPTFLEQKITHLQGNAISNLMRKLGCLRFLRKDSRTLLETPREPIKLRIQFQKIIFRARYFSTSILTFRKGLDWPIQIVTRVH